MTSFDTLQSISSRLKELSNQLSTSKLSKDELEEFETLSRKLYERAIILNYKAKEARVYGEENQKDPHSSASVPTPIPDVKQKLVKVLNRKWNNSHQLQTKRLLLEKFNLISLENLMIQK